MSLINDNAIDDDSCELGAQVASDRRMKAT
jgi:hypothetical protein